MTEIEIEIKTKIKIYLFIILKNDVNISVYFRLTTKEVVVTNVLHCD
jgi:hypothetical protein